MNAESVEINAQRDLLQVVQGDAITKVHGSMHTRIKQGNLHAQVDEEDH